MENKHIWIRAIPSRAENIARQLAHSLPSNVTVHLLSKYKYTNSRDPHATSGPFQLDIGKMEMAGAFTGKTVLIGDAVGSRQFLWKRLAIDEFIVIEAEPNRRFQVFETSLLWDDFTNLDCLGWLW